MTSGCAFRRFLVLLILAGPFGAVTFSNSDKPRSGPSRALDAIVLNMMPVPATDENGFVQGSPPGGIQNPLVCRASGETPFTHILPRDILVMETEVTRGMWAQLKALQPGLPTDPSYLPSAPGMNHPVQSVSWYETILFANLLSAQNGFTPAYYADGNLTIPIDATNYQTDNVFLNLNAGGYRLPTEGEWEHFARAGTTGLFSIDEPSYGSGNCGSCTAGALPALESVGWFCGNSSDTSHPVGEKAANAYGLKDVHGNAFEWIWDWFDDYPSGIQTDYSGPASDRYRTIRGGSWSSYPARLRSAARDDYAQGTRRAADGVGFRLVRTAVLEYEPNLVFSQWVNGQAGGVPNRTRIILRNNSARVEKGSINFMDSAGAPAPVEFGTAVDRFIFEIPPWGTYELETSGEGALQSGVIEVYSVWDVQSQIEGTEIFDLLGYHVSVTNSPPQARNQVYVSVTPEENSGVAIANTANQESVDVTMQLVDNLGMLQDSKMITVDANIQFVGFVTQPALFGSFFDGLTEDFHGTLNIVVEGNGSVAVLGLIQKNDTGALLAVPVSPQVYQPD